MPFTISIDRSGLAGSPAPIVMSGLRGEHDWYLLDGFRLPGKIRNNRYADESPFLNGALLVTSTLVQAYLNFDICLTVADAATRATAVAALEEALGQFTYDVTVDWDGEETVWTCDPADIAPSPLNIVAVRDHAPVMSISIPCYPVSA